MAPELTAFLVALEQTPRDWFLHRGLLRRNYKEFSEGICHCPLTETRCSGKGLLYLCFDPGPGMEVWHAADDLPGHDPELRRALLLACGIGCYGMSEAEKHEALLLACGG